MRRTLPAILTLILAGAALSLLGCDKYEPQSTEEEAARYYQDKYQEKVEVSDSHGLGNYALFGYSWGGTEYLMSDGTSVIYLDDTGSFSDNRQAAEIDAAAQGFAGQVLGGIPGALTSLDIERIGSIPSFETYEGGTSCWSTRYDGDIGDFLQTERPLIQFPYRSSSEEYVEGRFGYSVAYDKAQAAGLDEAYLDLARYFDLSRVTLAVVDPGAFSAGGLTLFDEGLLYTVSFKDKGSGKTEALHFKPVFVEVAPGVTVSSGTPGITLEEGDVTFGPHDQLGDGYYRCRIRGQAKEQGEDMHYLIRNDSPAQIVRVYDLDQFTVVCDAYQHTDWGSLVNGATYYLGDSSRIRPWIQIESVTSNKLVFSYHTHFKDQIKKVKLKVIGFAYKDGSTSSETVDFESRILQELDDGWRCEVKIRDDARPDNTFYFQFTYNDDEDVSVQIQEDVQIP